MKADTRIAQPRIAQAIDEVVRWRDAEVEARRARLAEIRGEQARLGEDIAELQRQISTLDDLAARVRQEESALPAEERARTRKAVDSGLDAEAELVRTRDDVLRLAQEQRDERVASILSQPDVARLIEEYEQFQEAQATLSLLPDGYRRAIEAHHQGVRDRLHPLMEAAQAPLPPYDGAPVSVSVIASISPAEGPSEALAVLLPVPFAVYEEGAERGEDLACLLAYRMVSVIGATLHQLGRSDATVQYSDYRGLLAIQVWFGEKGPQGDLRATFTANLDRARQQATELAAAGIEACIVWLDPEVITGGEDDNDPETHVDEPTAGMESTVDDSSQVEA